MNSLIADYSMIEEMTFKVHENLAHFIKPFYGARLEGVNFDTFQLERRRIDDCSDSALTVSVQKIFRVDTAEVICSAVARVSETGVVRYETIEAKFKYHSSDQWSSGSRSIMVDETKHADGFADEQYQEWARVFTRFYWGEWNHEAQTILEHLKTGRQYFPTHRAPVNKPGLLVEDVVCTPMFPGVNLSFSPALQRIYTGIGKLFDEHGLNVSLREVKTDKDKKVTLLIGIGVPELEFVIDVVVSPKIKAKGGPRKLENAISHIHARYYHGDDLPKAVANIAHDYELVRQKRMEALEAKFSQWEKFKKAGVG